MLDVVVLHVVPRVEINTRYSDINWILFLF